MSDPLEATTAIANAVEKTASLLEKVGQFFGPILDDYIGLHGRDNLHYRRMENAARRAQEAQHYIKGLEKNRISEPSPSVLLPFLKDAADEERKELCELWAKLLANAAVDGGAKIRREFFETLKQMEPIDAVILELFDHPTVHNANPTSSQVSAIANLMGPKGINPGLNNVNVKISLEALTKLGCLGGTVIGGSHLTSYGIAFKEACKVV